MMKCLKEEAGDHQNQCVSCRNDKHKLARCPDFLKADVKKTLGLSAEVSRLFFLSEESSSSL
jgi:hypothetical protein